MTIAQFVQLALEEDIKKGDHSALACIPEAAKGRAQLLVKEDGIIAGIEIAKQIFEEFDKSIELLLNHFQERHGIEFNEYMLEDIESKIYENH